jgi:uncharacterized RDD family membrane protein YckC
MIDVMTAVAGARAGLVLRRGLQFGLDTLFVLVLSVVVLVAFLGFWVLALMLGAHGGWLLYVPVGVWIATLVLGDLYVTIWFPYRRGGTTPAMRWLRMRIVMVDGGEPALKHYFLRWLMMAVDGLLFGLVGAALMAVTPKRQRLGDLVARTTVVRCGD